MEYEEIIYLFLHGNKSNNVFLFNIVNILGAISIKKIF